MLAEKSKAKPEATTGPLNEWEAIRLAEKYSIPPWQIEEECDEYWLNRIRTLAHGDALNEWRKDRERK